MNNPDTVSGLRDLPNTKREARALPRKGNLELARRSGKPCVLAFNSGSSAPIRVRSRPFASVRVRSRLVAVKSFKSVFLRAFATMRLRAFALKSGSTSI
jgi:hypothetical protein